ncbi:hypothetical protein BX616_000872 [Lobosporangium transversale]|uniref:Solute carrier family 35 member SLC35F1/F2/F6 n=1 Tax=Lobosporangium transversale TaxID=64571 RepID=A0A1Y2GNJ5_9FUNG|nr:solute carrier family 35 member SLC35F1/F2/F6 [Lobosporangium transversale]KAF9905956.1 hypothetical protein BX616_000872 [Lobosporangium transversale]ORZ15424.1 solute carrier family 35 member SLC35F1/F2/F6 [Lobosporangium transversale]|eukprot:XP_021881172.1 solute carrier family 35 member SLC35F1/F2/F6 [Lobosporangium transversale]
MADNYNQNSNNNNLALSEDKAELDQYQVDDESTYAQPSPVATPATWRERLATLFTRRVLTIVLLGQFLALCITATTILTTELAQTNNISIPTTQSFLNYLVLGVVYTTITLFKVGFSGWWEIIRRRSLYYILFALIDVEGNYFIVKAYSYTSLLSAMLLDAWTIPCVVLLSVFFLKMRFVRWHYLGVFVCLVGMAFLIWSDMRAGKDYPGTDYIKGDLFCLVGATFYAFSNVGQEYLVRQRPMYEVVGQLGFWATIINGIQLAILERHELKSITWTGPIIGYIIGFDIAMFLLYSVSPILLRLSSATFFNLSLLTSDFYGLLFGLFLFSAKINELYPIAYVLICLGIIIYNIYPAPAPKFKPRLATQHEESEAHSHV